MTISLGGKPVAGFSLGACPDIRKDGIYLEGRKVISLGLGDVADLLAYRREWEPFIGAHIKLWEYVNGILEGMPMADNCPRGIFTEADISQSLSVVERNVCSYLLWSRVYSSSTHPLGILSQWNAWKGRSSAEMVAGADTFLRSHQDVVMTVGGDLTKKLLEIGRNLKFEIELPEVPEFTEQQLLRAQIEGAYITTKGVLQILGYGANETLKMVGDVSEAVGDGLSATARKLPQAVPTPWTWIGVSAVLAVVGGVLLVYYVPRRKPSAA